jgi:hypothetical protein
MNQTSNVTRKTGDCEGCEKLDTVVRLFHGKNQWFCDSCAEIEIQRQVDSVRARQMELTPIQTSLNEASKIDSTIQVKTDLFNAATVAINELKATIESDSTIINKPYALAETLMARFTHFKQVVFELNAQIVEAGNQQKAIQIYLNNLANTLRAEEREKLQISNINYKPGPVKISKPVNKVVKVKVDKVELRKAAAELGLSEFTLQMIIVQKNITVAEAATMLRHSINAAKSE